MKICMYGVMLCMYELLLYSVASGSWSVALAVVIVTVVVAVKSHYFPTRSTPYIDTT